MDLLENIEQIWLGRFRGIFSQHARPTELLSTSSTGPCVEYLLPSQLPMSWASQLPILSTSKVYVDMVITRHL